MEPWALVLVQFPKSSVAGRRHSTSLRLFPHLKNKASPQISHFLPYTQKSPLPLKGRRGQQLPGLCIWMDLLLSSLLQSSLQWHIISSLCYLDFLLIWNDLSLKLKVLWWLCYRRMEDKNIKVNKEWTIRAPVYDFIVPSTSKSEKKKNEEKQQGKTTHLLRSMKMQKLIYK